MKKFSYIAIIALIFTVISCHNNVGLGELIDLEAPELSVARMVCLDSNNAEKEATALSSTIYTKKNATFYGEAFDNIAVTNVHAEIKYLKNNDYRYLKDATLNGGNWELNVNFPEEGACWLKIVAEDEKGNYSVKSSRVISLFVDEDAPIGSGWYIDRLNNGIQYSLQSYEKFVEILQKDLKLVDPVNKDVAQNDTFVICASFDDAAGIDASKTKIRIYDSNGDPVTGYISPDSGSGKYSPKFTITSAALSQCNASDQSLLQVRYSSGDVVENPGSNSVTDKPVDLGWFLWWPDSDKPRCSITGLLSSKNTMDVHVGDVLNITVFDDDALDGEVKCTITGENGYHNEFTYTVTNAERECNKILTAPDIPMTMTLNVTAKDKPVGQETPVNNLSFGPITVVVSDDFRPSLIITSPENNQIPSVTGEAKIHFSGITLDKVGANYVEFVWVPDYVADTVAAKKSLAEGLLNRIKGNNDSYKPSGDEVKLTVIKNNTFADGAFEGLRLWSAKLTTTAGRSATEFVQHEYNFDIPLIDDDTGFGLDKTTEKYIYARVYRNSSVYSDTEIKLAADNIKPTIVPVTPSGNMCIIDKDSSLTIEFKAEKSNRVPMNPDKYKIEYYAPKQSHDTTPYSLSGSYDETKAVYKGVLISADTIAAYAAARENPTVILYAEDVLGNAVSATYQAVISELPQIKSISSSASTKCKVGDDILINVSFTKAVGANSGTQLKLSNITNSINSKPFYADYVSGSGSTTLTFKYTVKEGDTSTGVQIIKERKNEKDYVPIIGMDNTSVHLETLDDADNLQAKRTITIDGVSPVVAAVSEIVISSDAETSNTVIGKTYLKAGRTLTVSVTSSEKVNVQGSPVFKIGSLELPWQSMADGGNTLVFSKKITSTDANEILKYSNTACIGNIGSIKDDYGNILVLKLPEGLTETSYKIDTKISSAPTFNNFKANGTGKTIASGKYINNISFTLPVVEESYTEYSVDGGSNWFEYNQGDVVSINTDVSLVARYRDYAGNISELTPVYDIEISSTFPKFSVECTNADGNYKQGSTLEFKVTFDDPVTPPAATTNSYIEFNEKKATYTKSLSSTEYVFNYTTGAGDDFTLYIAKDGVKLAGFTDEYGIVWNESKDKLSTDYIRSDLKCDSVMPYVVKMTPKGDKTTQNNLNAYSKANVIELEFNENVSVVSGKIYLRQTKGWAIPAMFTANEFNTVLAAAKAATIDTNETYGLTASKVLYMDGLEDAENLYNNIIGPANDRYHGTAQYVGPYKKMTNGINADGTPNLDVKYVLDFGVDIWESEKSTKNKFGLTYTPDYSKDNTKYTYVTYHKKYEAGWVNVVEPTNTITTDSIRYVLEQANFHQRYMAVNSSYVTVDKNKVTLNFPEGLLGDSALPLGREWELVIEKGAFMDETGNQFGYVYDSTTKTAKATATNDIQLANGGTDKGSWARQNVTESKPLVLIQDGNNVAFMSAGVEKPVIRVDRYSFGLGIKQPKSINNGVIEYETINSIGNTNGMQTGITTPTSKVAVKIDTASKAATIRYSMNSVTADKDDPSKEKSRDYCETYSSKTSATIPVSATSGTQKNTSETRMIFLAGSGEYTKSYKAYITADATVSSLESDKAYEGIFQTVVEFYQPNYTSGKNWGSITKNLWVAGAGKQIVNIHGTTGAGGEPTMVPFPLRDQPVCSAYMRQTYQNSDSYYWISYEVLKDGIFSMYIVGKSSGGDNLYATDNSKLWGDWAQSYGQMNVGEYNRCSNMRSFLWQPD